MAEGALYPTVSVQGSYTQNWLSTSSLSIMNEYNASVLGTLSVPIYQGGAEYSLIRQAKETLGQKRLDLDTARDQVRQNVVQAWGQLEAAKANIDATQAQVQAAEIALNGVREEARVGQRTTFDVLDGAADFGQCAGGAGHRPARPGGGILYAAVGGRPAVAAGARPARPGLRRHVHYQQVRDSWAGVRTPDGAAESDRPAAVAMRRAGCPQVIAFCRISACHTCMSLAYKRDSGDDSLQVRRRSGRTAGRDARAAVGITGMSQTAKVQEPSMEEILASIRRIIADDDAEAQKRLKPAGARAGDLDRVRRCRRRRHRRPPPIARTTSMPCSPSSTSAAPSRRRRAAGSRCARSDRGDGRAGRRRGRRRFRTIDASSDVVFTDRPAEPGRRACDRGAAPAVRRQPPRRSRALISASTVAAVDSAFNSLAHTVIGQNARTLEDLVKEMLRPMLKSWLDDNLPGVVERIVRAEIERVSRGR